MKQGLGKRLSPNEGDLLIFTIRLMEPITGNNNLRVAFYCRVSTEEQREGQTIESQIKELERFAGDRNWTTISVYKDEGWSGSILARPELDRLRDDASRGLFDAVLINDVDRLARDVTHLGIIKRDLERKNIRIVFKKLPGDQSPTQNLLINILGSFAEFERELIADRTRRGKRYKAEIRQQFIGSLAPYGLQYVTKGRSGTESGRLEIAPEEAALVRQMYQWVDLEGLSAQKVVARLNYLGAMPRKRGSHWQKSSVLRILRSQVYAGVWHYNKHQLCEPRRKRLEQRYRKSARTSLRLRPRAEWLPVPLPKNLRIVDAQQWARVQGQLDRNITFSPRNGKHSYLLSGLVRCGGCQSAYVGNPSHGRFGYRCSKRCKKFGLISARYLDETVWSAVEEALTKPDLIVRAVSDIRHQRDGLDREAAAIQRGLQQIKTEESRLLQAYRLAALSPELLAQELQALKARRALLQSRESTIEQADNLKAFPVRHHIERYCQMAAQRVRNLSKERRQRVLRVLLTRIVFEGSQIRITGRIPILSESDNIVGHISDDDKISPGRIATTAPTSCGRNVSEPSLPTDDLPESGDCVSILTFELTRKVNRDTSSAAGASRANLIKANIARREILERKHRPA
jgi:site-specific DNA recombinase